MISQANIDLLSDIYYQSEYSALYETDGEHFEFSYREGDYFIRFTALKRRIHCINSHVLNEDLYDLETPYGYGGPISNSLDDGFLNRAVFSYKKYCQKQKIVCEFIRFHPFNPLCKKVTLFDMHHHERNIVIVDLKNMKDERRKLYSKTTRNIVKKAEKKLSVEIDICDPQEFISLYYMTMKKNLAKDFYYFSEDYFNKLMACNNISTIAIKNENETVSIGCFLYGKQLAHYHLSANNTESLKENGNYLLLDAAFENAKLRGCQYMLLGGGRTSSLEDNLFKFKLKFSSSTLPFYIAGFDFIPEKKKMLNDIWIKQNKNQEIPKMFQLYRV